VKLAILLEIPDTFISEATYAIDNLFFPFELKVNRVFCVADLYEFDLKIIYCSEDSAVINNPSIPGDTIIVLLEERTLEYFKGFTAYNTSDVRWLEDVPCIFPLHYEKKIRHAEHVLPFDIIAASYFFLSCWQEYTISERDEKDRIPLECTIQSAFRIIRKPIVNLYLDLLWKKVKELTNITINKKMMPGNGSTYVALSHDVDNIDWGLLRYVRSIINERERMISSFSNILAMVRNMFGKKYIFDLIKKMEMNEGSSSSYFFLSSYTTKKHNQYADKMIQSLDGTSFEVGHHVSNHSVLDNRIQMDCDQFRGKIRRLYGGRVHTLRFQIKSLFRQLEENGYLYDNSLIFAENIGYRTGFSYPHYIFNPETKKPFDVVAIPLNVMDATLLDGKYMGLPDDLAKQELFDFFSSAIGYGGSISILFHNNIFFLNTTKRLIMYAKILKYFRQRDIKIGTCRELYLWRTHPSH
jgi:hypothetical protein|tara:strand:- start:5958 stop:7361 length:1404 start_codon:yes stop_codon:yes gene_type:complete